MVRARNESEALAAYNSKQPICITPWPRECWVMPTFFCLSSLFVPSYRQPRFSQSINLVHLWKTRKGVYTGPRLDLADASLFMALIGMHHQEKLPLGATFNSRVHAILSACKPTRKIFGSSDYFWAIKALNRLYDAKMILTRKKDSNLEQLGSEHLPLRLVKELSISSGSVSLQLDPRLTDLFKNKQFSLIDIKSHTCLGSDLSKALHLVVASHRERKQRHQLSSLLARLDYSLPTCKAKKKITDACQRLEAASILQMHSWENTADGLVLIIER